MPLSKEEWEEATVDRGMMKDIQSVLDEAHPKGLRKGEIVEEWDRTSIADDILSSVLEVLVGMDEVEVAVPDDITEGGTYYRLKK